jgi:hypothetical protein
MEPILLALAFVGVFTGLIIVGMRGNLYFYSRGAIRLARSRRVNGLRAVAAKSVPVQVTTGARESEIYLGLSTDPSSRYARGGLIVLASVLLLIVIAVVSLLVTALH